MIRRYAVSASGKLPSCKFLSARSRLALICPALRSHDPEKDFGVGGFTIGPCAA